MQRASASSKGIFACVASLGAVSQAVQVAEIPAGRLSQDQAVRRALEQLLGEMVARLMYANYPTDPYALAARQLQRSSRISIPASRFPVFAALAERRLMLPNCAHA
jgi:hypothetical protein